MQPGGVMMSGMPESPLDLSIPTHVHVIGVGGAGMSAIAEVLVSMGHTVSGSDLKASSGLDRLAALGVDVRVGHSADQVGEAAVVTRSTAVPDSNPECRAALERGIRLCGRPEVLGAISALRHTIAVAGTHGKTTTASMLALVLRGAGLRPSFIIGGDVNEIGTGAAWDEGDLLVVEADESDGSFLELSARFGLVTNLEPDHLEHHGGFGPLLEAVDGPVVVGVDDEEGAALAARHGTATVGTSAGSDWRLSEVVESWEGVRFTLTGPVTGAFGLELPVPGLHNARNAASAAAVAVLAGAAPEAVASALARFGGVARRFEHRGQAAGVVLVDDYAHLPTEVGAVLATARSGGFARVVAVFQPHRFSRTEALWSSFGGAFDDADVLYVTDVYPSGEAPRPGVSGRLVADAVLRDRPGADVRYVARREDLLDALVGELRDGDLCLTMGAGDLTAVPDQLRARLGAS
jgi:UDP-N-acetylmuramate--alanine ligase